MQIERQKFKVNFFSWFQAKNHWKAFEVNKKGWKRPKKCIDQLSGAGRTQAGRNTQQEQYLLKVWVNELYSSLRENDAFG